MIYTMLVAVADWMAPYILQSNQLYGTYDYDKH